TFIDKKIETDTLFIKASNSDYIGTNDEKLINYIFSNSKIIEIQNAGHWLHVDQPEILKTEIKNFLKNEKR
ncbi:alpha/beta hydrolase, partial [Bacteroidales bacterium OttesenSCG-928-I21]|nr:alpha/beta hydrolase [Bacteroidales bacterium OttesenSCG-928-I21]